MGERAWYTEAFDELYVELYAHRDQAEADRTMRWLARAVPLAGGRIADLGCGNGRHLRALRSVGAWPVGVELSPALLRLAARDPAPAGLVRADLRRLPLRTGSCDGVISMFTSLGYFATAAENRAVLEEAARIVRPAGFACIDYLNAALVRRRLPPDGERRAGAYTVRERRRLAPDAGRVLKEIEVEEAASGRPVRRYHESVALWDREVLTTMLEQAGWAVESVAGDYDGGPFVEDTSSRLVLLCRREPGL